MNNRPTRPASLPEDKRRGWCPRGRAVMWAEDGALIRLPVPGGQVSVEALARLRPIVEAYAAGGVLLTRRAKIELRGVGDPDAALLDLDTAGWLADPASEALPDTLVAADPTSTADATGLEQTLRRTLQETPAIAALPDKFLIVIDDGGRLAVPAQTADIRIDAQADDHWRVALAGDRDSATPGVLLSASAVPGVVTGLIATLATRASGQRCRALPGYQRQAILNAVTDAAGQGAELPEPAAAIDLGAHADFGWIVRFVFGVISTKALAELITGCGAAPIGVLPDRRLVLPIEDPHARDRLRRLGAIDDPDDPRNGLTACIGRAGCQHATTDTRDDAMTIAARWPDIARAGVHVSGCSKGCAGRDARAITLVGHDTRYDLVRHGGPRDRPIVRGLTLDGLAS